MLGGHTEASHCATHCVPEWDGQTETAEPLPDLLDEHNLPLDEAGRLDRLDEALLEFGAFSDKFATVQEQFCVGQLLFVMRVGFRQRDGIC